MKIPNRLLHLLQIPPPSRINNPRIINPHNLDPRLHNTGTIRLNTTTTLSRRAHLFQIHLSVFATGGAFEGPVYRLGELDGAGFVTFCAAEEGGAVVWDCGAPDYLRGSRSDDEETVGGEFG